MSIVIVTSHKGGIGKSTATTTIAVGLTALGYNVLVIDADPQGHAGLMLGMKKEVEGLYKWVTEGDKVDLQDLLYRVPDTHIPQFEGRRTGGCWLLPSSDDTRLLQYEFKGAYIAKQAKKIVAMAKPFDIVLMDTPAAMDPIRSDFDAALMFAADKFLVPTLCERLSVDGVTVAANLSEFHELQYDAVGKRAELLGIIPMRYKESDGRNRNVNSLRRKWGDLVWDTVRESEWWHKATLFDETILTYAPTSPAAAEGWRMVQTVEGLCLKARV